MAGQSGDEGQVLPQRELRIKGRLVSDQRDAPPDGERRFITHPVAEGSYGALGWPQKRGEHPQQSRLAGTVRADNSDSLPGGDFEVDAGENRDATVPNGDVLQLNYRCCGHGRRVYAYRHLL
jgi:hypothetical protein